MIIEAGYDLHTLMFGGKVPADPVRVVSLDNDFRVMSSTAAPGSFAGDLSTLSLEAIDEVMPQHDDDDEFGGRFAMRFVAIGFEVPIPEGYIQVSIWERHRAIQERFDCRGITFFGVYVPYPDMRAATGRMKTFATYVGAEDYPRLPARTRTPRPSARHCRSRNERVTMCVGGYTWQRTSRSTRRFSSAHSRSAASGRRRRP